MRARKVASAILEIAVSKESRDHVRAAVKTALEASRSQRSSAVRASERAREAVDASRAIRYYETASPAAEDEVAELWFPAVDAEKAEEADRRFFARLAREYPRLFARPGELGACPELPEDPQAFRALMIAREPLGLFAKRSAIEGKKVLELGAQAGERAKILAQRAKTWVGIDDSRAALALARLVSPENTAFIHPSKHASLAAHHGSVDTVVGRDLFVHQPLDGARAILGFIEPFLVRGGLFFAELFFPNADRAEGGVYPAAHPPVDASARFAYSRANVEALIQRRAFRLVHDEERPDLERRFVILERTEIDA